MVFRILFIFFFIHYSVVADTNGCYNCTTEGNRWCSSDESCMSVVRQCSLIISDPLNCPKAMPVGYEYSDSYTRSVILPIITGVYTRPNPSKCFKNALPTTQFYESIKVQCYHDGPNSTCHAFTAFDTVRKQIIVAFEGTEGNIQLGEEMLAFFHKKKNFFNVGNVFEYFYDAFYYLWNGGLQKSVKKLMYLYPDYELLSVGHSLGAAMSTIFASHAVVTNMYSPKNVKLVTFGQPRTGDRNFSMWHDNTFLYSYRVNHKRDPVPHIPPMGGPDEVFHHRYEVWYNNDMSLGSNYTICLEADGDYCSDQQLSDLPDDHVWYFDVNLNTWADQDCVPFN